MRIGLGRSVVFGVASVAAPAFHHGLSTLSSIVVVAMLAGAFAAWSWSLHCAPRNGLVLGAILVATQVLLHVILTVTSAVTDATPGVTQAAESGAHVHAMSASNMAHMSDAATSSSTIADVVTMLSFHLIAVAIGVLVLSALERRAFRAALRIVEVVVRHLRSRAQHADLASSVSSISALSQLDACDADARRVRREARGHARRGPPCECASFFAA